MESADPDRVILLDENSAYATCVQATPAFFVDGERVVGLPDESAFLDLLDRNAASGNECR